VGILPLVERILLGSDYEEGSSLMNLEQPSEIEISPIHNIERACFDEEDIQHIDIVYFSIGNIDEGGYVATQIEQSV